MSSADLPLTDQQFERLVDLLLIRFAEAKAVAPSMLTVDDICTTFQVSRAWVYDNAGRLGGVKLGKSRSSPLRFDAKQVMQAFRPIAQPKPELPVAAPRPTSKHLLPVYDG